MASETLLAAGVEPVPFAYTVPPAGELELLAVSSKYDGSGAAGDYVPTLIVRNPAGIIQYEVPIGETVVAGDDARVTWAPFLRAKEAAAGGGAAHYCHVVLDYATPSGSVIFPNGGTLMTIADFETDDPASYVQVNASSWQIPPVPQVISGFVVEQSASVVVPAADARIVAMSGGSVPFGPFVPSGTRFLTSWFGYTLERNIELQNDWHAFAAGGGVRLYSLTVTYFAVY